MPDSPKNKQTGKNNNTVSFKLDSADEGSGKAREKEVRNGKDTRKEKPQESIVNDEERTSHDAPARPHVRTREARSLNRLQAELDEVG